jgi:hypothetical protein
MRVVFLDIDGVLNRCDTRDPRIVTDQEPLPIPIEPACMVCLNRLIAETGAKIVISSSWRLFARWQDLGPALVRHGLVGDVIGETPNLVNDEVWLANWQVRAGAPFTFEKLERGWEIREWLAAHPEVTGFAILDDCSDMDELKPWLVLTHPIDGLDDPDVERAKWLLDRSTDGLALARDRALGTGRPCAECGYSGKTCDVSDWENGGFAWICVDEAACAARRFHNQNAHKPLGQDSHD